MRKPLFSVSGDQATFNCNVIGRRRRRASVSIVEVTNKNNEVRHQDSSFTAADLAIPQRGESHTRRFVCELWLGQKLLSRSKVAELIIIPSGKLRNRDKDFTTISTNSGKLRARNCLSPQLFFAKN